MGLPGPCRHDRVGRRRRRSAAASIPLTARPRAMILCRRSGVVEVECHHLRRDEGHADFRLHPIRIRFASGRLPASPCGAAVRHSGARFRLLVRRVAGRNIRGPRAAGHRRRRRPACGGRARRARGDSGLAARRRDRGQADRAGRASGSAGSAAAILRARPRRHGPGLAHRTGPDRSIPSSPIQPHSDRTPDRMSSGPA